MDLDLDSDSKERFFGIQRTKGIFGSLLGNIRQISSRHKDDEATEQQQQQSQLQHNHGLSLGGIFLAGSLGGPKNMGEMPSRIFRTAFRNPKWLLVGGIVYQSQKALRSEAFRRATRFWIKVGPMVVHYKFTRWWLTKVTKAPLETRNAVYQVLHETYSVVAMDVALELKGLYVKIAQVVSSRPDFIPQPYIELFAATQDSLPQWPIEDVIELIDASLRKSSSSSKIENQNAEQTTTTELLSFEDVFEDIDSIALGSASIGQCHKAKIKGKYARELLRASERESDTDLDMNLLPPVDVAVKVMHPGAEERIKHDFSVFRWLCRIALQGWEPFLDELYRQFMSELDYTREANSLATVRSNMRNSPFAKSVKVPKPLQTLCSKELLVMELFDGTKLSDSLEDELKKILGADRSQKLMDRKRLELVLGKDKLDALDKDKSSSVAVNDSNGESENKNKPATEESILRECGLATKLRLLKLNKRAQTTIDMLIDVQGYQILKDGVFQGDPHPGKLCCAVMHYVVSFHFVGRSLTHPCLFVSGNILELGNTKRMKKFYHRGTSMLGLIDYGQTKFISDEERLGIARVILALGETNNAASSKTEAVANAMRDMGFSTKNNDSKVIEQYAGLFFDSDEVGKKLYGCSTPQTYFKILTELDPLDNVPDAAIFVARCGFILRGMGSILGKQIMTSERWSVYAKQALDEAASAETRK